MANQVIIIGGGLSGLSAAHTVLERGGRVLVIDKNPFFGGNSTKATSGINGALTRTQVELGIPDSAQQFLKDTAVSAAGGKLDAEPSELAKVLTFQSASAVEWLQDRFNLDLSKVSRLGGHSHPRTHRGKERFPGMTITYALMEKIEEIASSGDGRARTITKARATKILTDSNGAAIGVEYEKDGQTFTEHGPVIIATGGYAADFTEDSILKKVRPDLLHLPTTNGEHCTGDGIKMAVSIGAGTTDLERVQVHPTGLVHPDEPNARVLFLAAEALRGVGGLLLDAEGNRFCNELGRRDYVSGEMFKHNKFPYRLVLNGKASTEIEWHCKHYCGRGLMKRFETGEQVASEMGIPVNKLKQTFDDYNEIAKKGTDQYGTKYFHNLPFQLNDFFNVAIVTPVVHYCMGGLATSPESEVLADSGKPIPGLWCAGEVCGGVHGQNRLGGSSLLDCVVFGRVSGANAAKYLLEQKLAAPNQRLNQILGHLDIRVNPSQNSFTVSWGGDNVQQAPTQQQTQQPNRRALNDPEEERAAAATKVQSAPAAVKVFTKEEVAKHNKEGDCWVIVNGQVLDVTHFLKDHPGGKKSILLFAGKDASEEFNMLHKPDVVSKYAPQCIIGKI